MHLDRTSPGKWICAQQLVNRLDAWRTCRKNSGAFDRGAQCTTGTNAQDTPTASATSIVSFGRITSTPLCLRLSTGLRFAFSLQERFVSPGRVFGLAAHESCHLSLPSMSEYSVSSFAAGEVINNLALPAIPTDLGCFSTSTSNPHSNLTHE